MAQIVTINDNINVKETVEEIDQIWAGLNEIMKLNEIVQITHWKNGMESIKHEICPCYINKRNVILFR